MSSYRRRAVFAGAAFAALLCASQPASADVSGWAHVGGGMIGWDGNGSSEFTFAPTMTIDMGVGSSDSEPFVFGGLFRFQPAFDHGIDLATMARFATRGFQTGMFGFALDAGGYVRTFGATSAGFIGEAVLGGPFGLQLAVMGAVGSSDGRAFGVTAGIDLARLLVHRDYLQNWWSNPRPEQAIGANGNAPFFGAIRGL